MDQHSTLTKSIGKYSIVDVIGKGGMGTVYAVIDRSQGTATQTYALKTLRPELAKDHASVKRFLEEASAVSRLNHPNLVTIYDTGTTDDGVPFIVMEHVEGMSLDKMIQSQKGVGHALSMVLHPTLAFDIALRICDAIEHAHNQGIIHRDLKPSNILISMPQELDGNSDTAMGAAVIVKVVDFGIAKIQPSINESHKIATSTNDEEILGSVAYMSPEQCMGERLDARSDIYSLGCVLYELFTGHPPFRESNPVKTVLQQLTEPPLPPSTLAGGQAAPDGLEAIIMRCLEKDPSKRFSTIDQLRKELEKQRDVSIAESKNNTLLPAVAYFHRRQRVWMIYCGVGLTGCLPALIAGGYLFNIFPTALMLYFLFCGVSRSMRSKEIDRVIRETQPIERKVVLKYSLLKGSRIHLVNDDGSLGRRWDVQNKGADYNLPKELLKYFDGSVHTLPVFMDPKNNEPVAVMVGDTLMLIVGQFYFPNYGWRF